MYLDSGRLADLKMLEERRETASETERNQIDKSIKTILRQAENPELAKRREELLDARRAATNARGSLNIKHARDTADKLEEKLDKEIRL